MANYATENMWPVKVLYESFVKVEREGIGLAAENARSREILDALKTWQYSPECALLNEHLIHNATRMVQIRKIICFSLGPLGDSNPHGRSARNRLSAAMLIYRTLSGIYNVASGRTDSIRMIFQDSAYTALDRKVLETLGVEVVNFPWLDGFLEVDETSLVITHITDIPIRQMIADLTEDKGGPAAIICCAAGPISYGYDEIRSAEHSVPDAYGKKVEAMLKGYESLDFTHCNPNECQVPGSDGYNTQGYYIQTDVPVHIGHERRAVLDDTGYAFLKPWVLYMKRRV